MRFNCFFLVGLILSGLQEGSRAQEECVQTAQAYIEHFEVKDIAESVRLKPFF